MKIQSDFAILDVKDGRHELAKHFERRPRLGECPPDLRVPVTITGYIDSIWSPDDGESREFVVIVERILTEPYTEPELTCPRIEKAIASGELSQDVVSELEAIRDINSQLRYGIWHLKERIAAVSDLSAVIKAGIEASVAIMLRVEKFAENYEYRDDSGGGYVPTDAERAMLIDFGHGLLAEILGEENSPSPTVSALNEIAAEDAGATVAELLDALRPFASIGELIDAETRGFADDDMLDIGYQDCLLDMIKVGEFRKAAAITSAEIERLDRADAEGSAQ